MNPTLSYLFSHCGRIHLFDFCYAEASVTPSAVHSRGITVLVDSGVHPLA